jgi:Protein of unknown function (DUF2550)
MSTALWVLIGVLLLLVVVVFLLRRRFLLSGLGAVTMWLRPEGAPRWSVGVAWYGDDVLLWYRALSLSVRPHQRLTRAGFRVLAQRPPGRDDLALPGDVHVVECSTAQGRRELAMDRSTVTGFLSWLESAPPGS